MLKLKIASPCHARWEDMPGDERSRFCGQCEKQVYNFSSMSNEEVTSLIREKEGKICARFYQRKDGTLLTENCPAGKQRFLRKVKIACCSAVACALLFLGAWLATASSATRAKHASKEEEMWDEAVWKIKGLFGIQRPVMLMGDVCIPSPVAPAIPAAANQSNSPL